ncbi:large subunit ribosomal protein L31e [Angomonas deanei]|uniref:Ribosomal protein L31e, putative n=1 Tax=Angomonas deanei TaxID=59799 RepID=S9VER4_9TRYP|nr:large subunit ribosomal protein L31e [Angomonas deanei]EPY38912.1 large subunit ribosomal protein L31e [Angomonas deanei]EPY39519.1 large subunit ribosomal protein L31e [Angomonas deanei]EPY42885.1 large subunit ribosomal protein L31e [Angomonas deanei]CAD2216701.1 Ribosomal protein L31e, putative [Angomonas deanei]|eukprot:EPY32605.1 large subunit ribosomal protein L31e [Angomonas deanei]
MAASPKVRAARKEKRVARFEAKKASVESRKKRDDKKWKRVLSKMDDEKRKQFRGVGNTGKNSRVRGATRASLRKRSNERKPDDLSMVATIHLAKLLKKKTFHKRAPLAIKRIKSFVAKLMKTKDNRIDASLNTYIWHKGVKGVPGRVRVRIDRHSETPEGSKRKRFYTIISNVPVDSFKNLTTETLKE